MCVRMYAYMLIGDTHDSIFLSYLHASEKKIGGNDNDYLFVLTFSISFARYSLIKLMLVHR